MADRLKKAAVWLGLVSDHDYAEDEGNVEDVTEEVPQRTDSPAVPATVTEIASRRPAASQPKVADLSRIITVHPRTFNEARTIGENFRDGIPVIMNLTEMEDVDARRLVDFAAGLIFGVQG
ncbi:MAG: cell division protein SepF, partial [Propionicimonas sp.]|nr:cell division protein SepF [Propionicimonas sp.]